MKRLITVLMAAAMLTLWSCDTFTGGGQGDQTDTITQPVDSTMLADDDVLTVRGEAVDGSRRNIYVQMGDSTYSFELDPSIEVEWEIGDTLMVRYKTTELGDSVIEVQNCTA